MCFRPSPVSRDDCSDGIHICCQTCGMPVDVGMSNCPYCGDPIPPDGAGAPPSYESGPTRIL